MRYAMRYNNYLTIGASPEGLYLALTVFFVRAGHPALFMPWSEISVSTIASGWFRGRTRLRLGRNLQIPFTIRTSLAQQLQKSAGQRWPIESFV